MTDDGGPRGSAAFGSPKPIATVGTPYIHSSPNRNRYWNESEPYPCKCEEFVESAPTFEPSCLR